MAHMGPNAEAKSSMTTDAPQEHEQAPQRRRLIYLTGFMGSGKSTVGPILANTLGFEFVDIDKLIEQKAEQPIVQLFETVGEKGFRSIEREVLREVACLDGYVVSLGGGTIANDENFQLIRQSGIVVYLRLPPEEILQRVRHKHDRPMLKGPDGSPLPPNQLAARIEQLLRHREQFYERADIVISADKQKVGTTVDAIVRRLKEVLGQ